MSFVKMSAGRRGYVAPSDEAAAAAPPPPLPAHLEPSSFRAFSPSSAPREPINGERKRRRQACTDCGFDCSRGDKSSPAVTSGRSSSPHHPCRNISRYGCDSASGEGGSSVSPSSSSRSSTSSVPSTRSSNNNNGNDNDNDNGERFLIAGVGVPPGVATVEEETVAVAAADGERGVYSGNSCSVCLDEYEEGDQLLQLTCGHVFHQTCIDHWLKGHRVCPCCR